ncbi:MAG TPA: NADH-quinone oxidoreductase subunit J [Saprospiraceae bacterium]|jgi:NADH-quinone oxidoreductase subunit J|nr:NADH-quinone oxidoreductase subunit J [Saprospiraceae bacterium]HRO07297.1 NADH-quinone oxidoreductase subunit J [Saprospiraceae bacterium]HRP40580.1 NADH-quinone oxidoreductase subunit J [Saprospiraceae bacterium]
MAAALFYALSLICIVSSLIMIFHKNTMYSVLFLLVTFFSVAGLYVTLNAQFLAIVHIIVYAGAIMVLFLYVIMFLNMSHIINFQKSKAIKIAATATGLMFLLVIIAALSSATYNGNVTAGHEIGLASTLGHIIFNEFLIPFEVSSILFLSAMVGVVIFNKKDLIDE